MGNKGTIIMYGDSLTEYYPMEQLSCLGYQMLNRGGAGETIAEIRSRLKRDVLSMNPEIVILQGGANDVQLSFYPGAKMVAKRLMDLALTIREHLPEATLYVESLYPAYTKALGNMPPWPKEKSNEEIRRINEEIERCCKEEDLIYLDLFSQLVGEDGQLPRQYTIDGLHLTKEAYQVVTRELIRAIKE